MKNIIKYIGIVFVGILVTSCFDDVPPVQSFDVVTSNYDIAKNSTFFKIRENITHEVENKPRGAWDLALQSEKSGGQVLINYTTAAKVIDTKASNFTDVDEATLNDLFNSDQWKFNDPAYSNIKDSVALHTWENQNVFILNRGAGVLSQNKYYKIQFVSKTANSVTFKYGPINDNTGVENTVNSNALENITVFSFDTDDEASFQPKSSEWDFFLSPYLGWFETLTSGEFAEYTLTGVIINNESGLTVAAIHDENIIYEDMDLPYAQGLAYTSWKGVIGSTWKKIPAIDNPLYEMDTDKKYIFKHTDGNYYKLRFTSFYNTSGEQGYPSFEIKKL
ncbi:MAG: hypothetical protein GQ552_05320 [Flavobacteriaceae bacterium]|nr:hypothetical protein [Flavobacteriaceae bacterium]